MASIRVLSPEAAVMERNHLAHDIVAETPAAEGKPVLALARWHTFELFNVVTPRTVIGIFG
jgi:hypothetical protein